MIVHAQTLHGTVAAPPSKSVLHRRLILNRIAGSFDMSDRPCDDIQITADCLRRLGTDLPLNCGESGSTLRFLLPVSLLFGGATFFGSESLMSRPIKPLTDLLREHGAAIDSDALQMTVRGSLNSGIYELDGDISSQFFTGLMLTLPFLSGDSTLLWRTPLESAGYVRLTERMLSEHGIKSERLENGFHIFGNQTPKQLPIAVEGDWSSAASMLILGAMTGSVTVTGLALDSEQPDRRVLSVLEQCGASVHTGADGVTVSRAKLRGFKFNGSEAPDLVPILAALACASESDSVLYRLNRLRYKESDRFDALTALLRSIGADFETERDDTIVIHGNGSVKGGKAALTSDHRMVMAATLMSACSAAPIVLSHPECVTKSYPDFFRDFASLGGQIDAI